VNFDRLADQYIQNGPIHRVVLAVEQVAFNHRGGLAVAIDSPLPLLQAIGVPGQVVVDHCLEGLLKVDPFT
jgi:hypothetical protein